ncbi:hypothetical protein VTL71DRAFT_13248 [Oculimacula yallundae]|uniref:Uncharacterized protein n=1 Tax=Oculimacula yallundae TaxID=86028 RepID=A0ABR4CJT4_9HELO
MRDLEHVGSWEPLLPHQPDDPESSTLDAIPIVTQPSPTRIPIASTEVLTRLDNGLTAVEDSKALSASPTVMEPPRTDTDILATVDSSSATPLDYNFLRSRSRQQILIDDPAQDTQQLTFPAVIHRSRGRSHSESDVFRGIGPVYRRHGQ